GAGTERRLAAERADPLGGGTERLAHLLDGHVLLQRELLELLHDDGAGHLARVVPAHPVGDQEDRGHVEDAVLVGGSHVPDVGDGGGDDPDRAVDVRVRQRAVDHCILSTDKVRSPSVTCAPAGRTVGESGTRFSLEPSSRRMVDPFVDPRSVTMMSSPVPSMRRCVLETERVSSFITNSTSSPGAAGLRPMTTGFSTTRSLPSSVVRRSFRIAGSCTAEMRVCSRSPSGSSTAVRRVCSSTPSSPPQASPVRSLGGFAPPWSCGAGGASAVPGAVSDGAQPCAAPPVAGAAGGCGAQDCGGGAGADGAAGSSHDGAAGSAEGWPQDCAGPASCWSQAACGASGPDCGWPHDCCCGGIGSSGGGAQPPSAGGGGAGGAGAGGGDPGERGRAEAGVVLVPGRLRRLRARLRLAPRLLLRRDRIERRRGPAAVGGRLRGGGALRRR